jgi:hypothetical protein
MITHSSSKTLNFATTLEHPRDASSPLSLGITSIATITDSLSITPLYWHQQPPTYNLSMETRWDARQLQPMLVAKGGARLSQ